MGRPRKYSESITATKAIPMDAIFEPRVPDRVAPQLEEIKELAFAIKTQGLLQPISVFKIGTGFEIIFGHRRFLAHKYLREDFIRCNICDYSPQKILRARLSENIDRKALSIVEEAAAIDRLVKSQDMSAAQIAEALAKSEAWVSQRRAINNYPVILRAALAAKDIPFSVSRILARIKDPSYLQTYLRIAIENGATPSVVQRWVDELKTNEDYNNSDVTQTSSGNIPEPSPTPTGQCYFCDQQVSYSKLRQIWIDTDCLKSAIDAVLEVAEKQSKDGG